jgi:signal transduction histidine kinase
LAINFPEPEISRTVSDVAQPVRHLRDARTSLLVVRLVELERIAWRAGKRAAQRAERAATRVFEGAVRALLRRDDALSHDAGSDVFAVRLLAPGRNATQLLPCHCRSVLQRISAAMSLATGSSLEAGWSLLPAAEGGGSLACHISNALERGRRERERYDFFTTVGHELRTPLASIRGHLETLLQADCDASMLRRFLETARGEALRLGRLVDNMFEFSLLDGGGEHLHHQGCDVRRAIRTATDILAPIAAHRCVSIQLAETAACVVLMDADACVQTLVNIVDNAIRHGREGGRIAISSRTQGDYVCIDVDDDGMGVSKDERSSIFQLGVRGALAYPGGTGIGLAIARRLTDRAGGDIVVGESPLGGARFQLCLPLQAESLLSTS